MWRGTRHTPHEERGAYPAPGVCPAPTKRVRLQGPEPAILTAKEQQALSNGRGGTDRLRCAVAPAVHPGASIEKMQGAIVGAHIDQVIQERWGSMDPALRTGPPA